MKRLLVCFLSLAVANAFAQNGIVQDFVIDQSKPYVYLKFDHIGPRKPVQDGEGDTGIWLRVVNNCRIPIVLAGVSASPEDPGFVLLDDVLEEEPYLQIYSSPQEEKHAQEERRLRLQRLKHEPKGYSFETAGILTVQPGENILFSVPRNHVSSDWYMRVKLALDLNSSSISIGPFTYLPFYEWNIPKEFRPTKVPNGRWPGHENHSEP